MIKRLSIVLLFMSCSVIFGQESGKTIFPIHVSYYGENLIHPGIKVGTSYRFHEYQKSKIRRFKGKQLKWGSKIKYKRLSVIGNLGFYNHPNNDFGLMVNTGLSYERVKSGKGNLFGLTLELGYLRTFNHFKTVAISDQGEIDNLFLAGQNSMMLSMSPVFGRDLSIKRDLPVTWFVKPSIQLLKYNHAWLPNAAFELGTIFYLKH